MYMLYDYSNSAPNLEEATGSFQNKQKVCASRATKAKENESCSRRCHAAADAAIKGDIYPGINACTGLWLHSRPFLQMQIMLLVNKWTPK
jgi:hypothetical protein